MSSEFNFKERPPFIHPATAGNDAQLRRRLSLLWLAGWQASVVNLRIGAEGREMQIIAVV